MYHHCCSYLGWFEIVQKVLCGRLRHGGGFSNQQSDCTNVILFNTDMDPTIMYNASKYGSININAWFMHGDWICMVGYISCSMAIHSTQCLTFQDKNTSSPRSVPGRFRTCIYIHDNASEVCTFNHGLSMIQQTATVLTCLEHDASLLPSFLKPQLTEGQLQKCI